jgi:hypothetical protein
VISDEYVAGLFDGEGCVFVHCKSKKLLIQVSIGNTYPRIALLLRKKYGGTVQQRQWIFTGWRTVFIWYLEGKKVIPFLETILPYLVIKRRQARLALSLALTLRSGGSGPYHALSESMWEERERIAAEVSRLNRPNKDLKP